MRRAHARALVLFLTLLVACAGPRPAATAGRAPAGATGARHVVLISIDGLRPEFYLDPSYPAPMLKALATGGSHARAVEPVFPSVTYPNHAAMVTGVRPSRHGVLFNVLFEPTGERGRWYEEAADLRVAPLWEWARAAGLSTASISWPSTYHAKIDLLLPERDYYVRPQPFDVLAEATTPALFERTKVAPSEAMFKDVVAWDAFLAGTAAGIIRDARPHLLLLHLVQTDFFQHRHGRDAEEVKRAVVRVDAHVASLLAAMREAGIADRTAVVITGDHGFQDFSRYVFPNQVLARAGLRGCPTTGEGWRATLHVAGGSAAVFVDPRGDAGATRAAEVALRSEAGDRYTIVSRGELDALGAMDGAAFALEAAPGYAIGGSCDRGLTQSSSGGTHGFLPSRKTMATGFIANGDGVRAGVALNSMRLIDIAPTVARLLGLTAPPVEGRVLTDILR